MKYKKMTCDECGKEFTTEPLCVGRSIFPTIYGNFCTDWGQTPDTGCWPKVCKKREELVAQNVGLPGNVEKYWAAHDLGKGLALACALLSDEQKKEVFDEHGRRREEYFWARNSR